MFHIEHYKLFLFHLSDQYINKIDPLNIIMLYSFDQLEHYKDLIQLLNQRNTK
jgi:hypothetical protein